MVESNPTTDNQILTEQLSELVAMETHSLARHLESAKPYLSATTYSTWTVIQQMSVASHRHEQRLAQLIARLGLTLRPGTFQPQVAHYHDMDLNILLPRLVDEKRRLAAAYQRAVEQARDAPSVADELQDLLDEIKDQHKQLQAAKP